MASSIKNIVFRKNNVLYVFISLLRLFFIRKFWSIKKKIKGINKPIIHLYAICRNEEAIIPFFMQHYSHFVDHFYIYDNYSDDNTDKLLEEYANVTVIKFDTGGKFDDATHLKIRQHAWKKSRGKADYVIMIDIDEFLYYSGDIFEYLDRTIYSVFQTQGYDMYTATFPTEGIPLTEQVKNGVPNSFYNKSILFNPNKIVEINYTIGGHGANPNGIVRINSTDFKMLHYKNLSLDYIMKRVNSYRERFSKLNIDKGYGSEYLLEDEKIKKDFDQKLNQSEKVIE